MKKVFGSIAGGLLILLVIVGGFYYLTGGPVVYMTTTGEIMEGSTFHGDKEIFHSPSWVKAHRKECQVVYVAPEYEPHVVDWVD